MQPRSYGPPQQGTRSKARLYCLAHAGGSVNAYRQLLAQLPRTIEVSMLELPGRGTRMNEPFAGRMEDVVPGLAWLVKSGTDGPFSIFGHSMGALVAFEVSRYVQREYGLTAQCLFVSGMRAPHLRDRRFLARSLSDAELLSRIVTLGGIPKELWKHPDLVSMMMQTIRADIDICERYRYEEQSPLAVAIEAFGGQEDPYVSPDEIRQWKTHTLSSFNFTAFEGGHFFIFDVLRDIAAIISSKMSTRNGEN